MHLTLYQMMELINGFENWSICGQMNWKLSQGQNASQSVMPLQLREKVTNGIPQGSVLCHLFYSDSNILQVELRNLIPFGALKKSLKQNADKCSITTFRKQISTTY